MPEFIDPVFAKTNPKRSFSIIENERFGFVFAKTGSENSGSVLRKLLHISFSLNCPAFVMSQTSRIWPGITIVDILPTNGTVSFYSIYS